MRLLPIISIFLYSRKLLHNQNSLTRFRLSSQHVYFLQFFFGINNMKLCVCPPVQSIFSILLCHLWLKFYFFTVLFNSLNFISKVLKGIEANEAKKCRKKPLESSEEQLKAFQKQLSIEDFFWQAKTLRQLLISRELSIRDTMMCGKLKKPLDLIDRN